MRRIVGRIDERKKKKKDKKGKAGGRNREGE